MMHITYGERGVYSKPQIECNQPFLPAEQTDRPNTDSPANSNLIICWTHNTQQMQVYGWEWPTLRIAHNR